MPGTRIPPLTANILQACNHCFKDENVDHKLAKCSQCKAVAYCGSVCQKADWKHHKAICKAIIAVEKDQGFKAILLFFLSDKASSDINNMNRIAQGTGGNEYNLVRTIMKRDLTIPERNLMGQQPRCMGCARTERIIRMENSSTETTLKPCQDCRTSFYCSDAHWEVVRDIHTTQPCEDGHDGLTQCQLNREIRADILFVNIMADAHVESGLGVAEFQWAPERTKSSWQPLESGPKNWEAEFGDDLKKGFGGAAATPMTFMPFLRASTEGLSFPMTILYGLQKLKSGVEWTTKRTLTVHVLGALHKEVGMAQLFEEILHRLPQIVLIDPELAKVMQAFDSSPVPMETCPNCKQKRRTRVHEHHAATYHEYVKKQGSKYNRPDIAIAFNSGIHESASSWQETVELLVQKSVPFIFTSYNREEAEADAKLLKAAGAALHPNLGPMKNPWGSMRLIQEPNRVHGFYSTNGWLAGGFMGEMTL
ncbi:zinc finger mynd domain-containing protein 17 [Moniliophthora roreri]|uniref:MYND-type domain-containing protein n=1 Tax=Moniliophthora roreri TaxID=221103 RepID=A0A0W0FP38_MONRR|nr:zinc finger mynd domain-containing protein 17 [Moniliophthora roreri]